MRIRLLGTAAGGGVPQWNCNCSVCHEARAGTGRVQPRTQSSVAITADEKHWFLLNASPDLRAQIEGFPPLQPPIDLIRGSPIQAVLLTNADLDHTLGLFLLREGERLCVHATTAVRNSLTEGISLAGTLSAFCGIEWINPPALSPLLNGDGTESGLLYETVSLAGQPPRFSRGHGSETPVFDSTLRRAQGQSRRVGDRRSGSGDVVGYRFVDSRTGGRLLFLPDVASLDEELRGLLAECDVLLFDGTFWAEDEMQRVGVGNLTAASMGHVPISGPTGSLEVLKDLRVKQRIYIHINNTNPIFLEGSAESVAVAAAGWTVGADGMEIIV
jgi:pyrroloquinoline quinone biosynthesis protein B